MAQGVTPPAERSDSGLDPFQRQILREQLDRVAEEKRRALEDPGPTWREWFLQTAAKWWLLLAFFVVDAWLLVVCLTLHGWTVVYGLTPLFVALYLEFLTYRFLWYSPLEVRRNRRFQPTWYRPVPYGRWTPEAEYFRTHPIVSDGVNPDDFL